MWKLLMAVLAMGMGAASPASAHFVANLSGAQEVVPTGSPGTGSGSAMVGKDGRSLAVTLDWQGLSAPVVAGHIHCCAAPGTDNGVAILLMPDKVAAGSLAMTVDLDAATGYTKAFLDANGGTPAAAKAALLKAMAEGRAYFNLHTAAHPAGEIRGNIMAMKH